MKKEVLKQLKADYERLEIRPSADLWDRIDQKQEKAPETVSEPSFQWWKYAAVILILISVGSLLYYNSSKNEFDYNKTEYIVKEVLKKTVNPANSDLGNQPVISDQESVQQETVNMVNEDHKEINSDKILTPKKEEKVIASQHFEHKEQQIMVNPSENKLVNQEKAETNPPVIAETQRLKSSYIDADELLQGREFDKNRAKANKDNQKFGVIHFNKVVPNVGNVTVLGVTVYLDSK